MSANERFDCNLKVPINKLNGYVNGYELIIIIIQSNLSLADMLYSGHLLIADTSKYFGWLVILFY